VRETAGLIATYEGQPIDALYSATCGGETSDVGTMFPGRNEPYLRRAKCVELEMLALDGRADSGLLSEMQLNARLFAAIASLPESTSWAARDVFRAVLAAMTIAGHGEREGPLPASSRRRDVLEYLDATMGLASKARVVTMPEDRKYFPQSGDVEMTHLAAAFLEVRHLARSSSTASASTKRCHAKSSTHSRRVAAETLTRDVEGKSPVDGRRLSLKNKGEVTTHALPSGIPIFRKLGDRHQEYRSVPVMIGDRATVITGPDKRVAALVVQANYDGAAFDRTSSYSNWTRSYRADELVTSINRRNPIRQLVDIRPTRVDESKRIAELEVTAEDGRSSRYGLPVRWSLNVPDNCSSTTNTRTPTASLHVLRQRLGLARACAVGAYGMAFRGWGFERILKNLRGVEITRAEQADRTIDDRRIGRIEAGSPIRPIRPIVPFVPLKAPAQHQRQRHRHAAVERVARRPSVRGAPDDARHLHAAVVTCMFVSTAAELPEELAERAAKNDSSRASPGSGLPA
jgi:stage II sporulation protein D